VGSLLEMNRMWLFGLGISQMELVSAKSTYNALVDQNLKVEPEWWFHGLWKLQVPIKLILFMWLSLHDRILTGENFRRRGGIGPTACSLCLQDEETTQHLMVSCEITQQIWKEVCGLLKLNGNWNLLSLKDNY
jgi:hypothetical protein